MRHVIELINDAKTAIKTARSFQDTSPELAQTFFECAEIYLDGVTKIATQQLPFENL